MLTQPERPPRAALLDFGLCLLFALAWAWPLPARLTSVLRDPYDAMQQAWNVAWAGHALTSSARLFDANVLAPARDTLAFSEPLVGYGVAGRPLSLLGLSPAGVANGVCLLGLAFAPWALASLAGALGASRRAALLAGLAASFGALATLNLGYVSFAAWGGIPLVVLAWVRLRRFPSLGGSLALGAAFAGLGWFSLQLFSFTAAALAALAAVEALKGPRDFLARRLPRLLLSGAVASILLVPLALPLLRVRRLEGFRRDEAETRRLAATPASWITTTPDNPGQAFLPFRSGSEKALYPGTTALALALAGAVAVCRRRSPLRPLGGTGTVLLAVGFLGSLGYGGPLYPVLVRLAPPLFGGIRGVARFAFVGQVGIGLLAAAGATALLAGVRRPVTRTGLLAAGIVAVAVDTRQTARFEGRPENPPPPAETFLARADVGGPILHLPLKHDPGEAALMLASTAHFKQIVNGILSYVPRRNFELAEKLAARPIDPSTFDRLERWPVGTIVLHEERLSAASRASTLRFLADALANRRLSPPLKFDHRGGTDWVFGVVRVRRAEPFAAASGGGDPSANAEAFLARAGEAEDVDEAPSDETLALSIDEPAGEAEVTGELVVRGWAQDERGPIVVREFDLDGARREPRSFRRTPRPDVAQVFPRFGACEQAGYEARFPRLPGDEGRHVLRVTFRSAGGRVRKVDRPFRWN